MMMTRTTSTFEIEQRARAALAAGRVFEFTAPGGTRVEIGYVAGGSFASTKTTSLEGERLFGQTGSDTDRIMRHFVREVALVCGDVVGGAYNAGVIASIKRLDEMIAKLDIEDEVQRIGSAAIRTARRGLLELLDNAEVTA